MEVSVPLWLALYLRKRNLCRILPPSYLSVSNLTSVLAHERDPTKDTFAPSDRFPFRHAEVSRAVLDGIGAARSGMGMGIGTAAGGEAFGSGDGNGTAIGTGTGEVERVEAVRVLLEDIAAVRMDKIRKSVHSMSKDNMGKSLSMNESSGGGAGDGVLEGLPMPIIDVTGIGSAEMVAVKPFLEKAFEDHFKLVRAGIGSSDGENGAGTRARAVGSARRSRNLQLSSSRRRARRTNANDNSNNDVEDQVGGLHQENENEDDEAMNNVSNDEVDDLDLEEPRADDDGDHDDDSHNDNDNDGDRDANAAPAMSKSIRRYRS